MLLGSFEALSGQGKERIHFEMKKGDLDGFPNSIVEAASWRRVNSTSSSAKLMSISSIASESRSVFRAEKYRRKILRFDQTTLLLGQPVAKYQQYATAGPRDRPEVAMAIATIGCFCISDIDIADFETVSDMSDAVCDGCSYFSL
jgi:hypothetical protein